MIKQSIFAGLLLSTACLSQAATLYVDSVNGSDANDCTSKTTACATPWEAHTKAAAGDEILITKGAYNQPVDGCQQWLREPVSFKGGYDNTFNDTARSSKAEDTVFKVAQVVAGQPNATCRLFVITTGDSDWTVFDTLTIENAGQNGGGSHSGVLHMFASDEVSASWLRLDNVIMRNNNMKSGNGAINVVDGTGNKLEVINSLFKNNAASTYGGAIAVLADTDVDIKNTSFIDNQSQASGSAIYLAAGNALIKNSTFSGNDAQGASSNGAIAVNGATVIMEYNTLANNTGGMSGGLFVETSPGVSLKGNLLLGNKNSSGDEVNIQLAINSSAFSDLGYNLFGAEGSAGVIDNSGNPLALGNYFDHQNDVPENTSVTITKPSNQVIKPVAYNGGPSTALTHKLIIDSKAVNYIPNESVPYYGVGTTDTNPFISLKQARATVGLDEGQYGTGKLFYFDLDGSYDSNDEYSGKDGSAEFSAVVDENGWVKTTEVVQGQYGAVEAETRSDGEWVRGEESFCAGFGITDGRGMPRSDKTKPEEGVNFCDVGAFEFNNFYRQDCEDEDGQRPENNMQTYEVSWCLDPRDGITPQDLIDNLGSFNWYWSALLFLILGRRFKLNK